MDYNTNQNIIVKYPCGAGGKFLISCLFLFDKVAHWVPEVQNHSIDYLQWFQAAWPKNVNTWTKYEPQQPWNINFYSRRFERNNQLSCSEYNLRIESEASDYFFQCWNNGLKIVDHYHKRANTKFQTSALNVEILINDDSLTEFLKFVKNKVWLWDHQTRTVISTLDHPDYAHNEINRAHRVQFGNNYYITGYTDYDDFFQNYALTQPYILPFYNVTADPNCIASLDFLDLMVFDRFVGKFAVFENYFDQQINRDLLKYLHTIWISRSQSSMSQIF